MLIKVTKNIPLYHFTAVTTMNYIQVKRPIRTIFKLVLKSILRGVPMLELGFRPRTEVGLTIRSKRDY